jgi:sec-independent protein translocase protein TatA
MIGFTEWCVILLVLVLVIGIPRLPQIGESLGKAVRNFRRASRGGDELVVKRRPPPPDEPPPQ